ncbi:MAG: Bug family tripartite tricarboxylate transporter substrate binding protein [Longimicrobiales bacterium]
MRLIVPGAAGSGTDIAARLISQYLAKSFGQPFVVDNKPGANGMLGIAQAAKAPNDGYTLLFSYGAAQVVNQSLYPNCPYDGDKDFEAIAQVGAGGNLLVVPVGLSVNNLQEFIAYVKSKPADSLSYGSWGNGSGGHLSMEALKIATGIRITHIPYRSAAESNTALMAGQIEAGFSAMATALPLIQGGKLKAIAVSSPYTVQQLPLVKTMTEQGVKFDVSAWYGLFAPKGTPRAIVNAVNAQVNALLKDPAKAQRIRGVLGLDTLPIRTPEEFQQQVRDDIRDWGDVVRKANIKIE